MHLYQVLAQKVKEWCAKDYPCISNPAIAEILEWVKNPEISGFKLRPPQIAALETYWYLRLVEQTPHILDLYKTLIPETSHRLESLGITHRDITTLALDLGFDGIIQKVKEDDVFVKQYRLEALREALDLLYPSYILALAMGSGKTILIGAIYATEFAMAQEYPQDHFVRNALIFAPGKTIIESLRELAAMRYDAVLPPRMYKQFAASIKLTFTRDGETTIPIVHGSSFNVIVTNTEKIRIQKETVRKKDLGSLFSAETEEKAKSELANLRLQAIASLPDLAVFSDEAHHTYGQSLDSELKKVRRTVNYLYNPYPAGTSEYELHKTDLICVVNTTGTPYFKRQMLKEVVIWYGLSQGIHDGILKELTNNIRAFDFEGHVDDYLSFIIRDFFKDYGAVALPDGTPSKLAIFFPQTDDVENWRPLIETRMAEIGLSSELILEHHTAHEEKEEFDRFRYSQKRLALLVSRGVEGWNVPALFACALARRLQSSNNFVLQAASRCLRQVPGNREKARIYLSMDNRSILDRQLQETFGETINELDRTQANTMREIIRLRKVIIPPLVIRKKIRTVFPGAIPVAALKFKKPDITEEYLTVTTLDIETQRTDGHVLRDRTGAIQIESAQHMIDMFTAAQDLASIYRLDTMYVLNALRLIYPTETEIPLAALEQLQQQVEQQTRRYEVKEETIEVALALVNPAGFEKVTDDQGVETYTAEISVPLDRIDLLTRWQAWRQTAGELGFHYDPYNFDSRPEKNFFEQILQELNQLPEDIEDIYFTGAITDPHKTDFFIHYKGMDGDWHRYFPDFLIRRKDGKCLIVEIKAENERADAVNGEDGLKSMAIQKWTDLNPELLKYEMVFTSADVVGFDQIEAAIKKMNFEQENE